MDASSLIGVLLALVGILAGLLLEGGHVGQILQPTAAMIVFGGTAGAVMLQFPMAIVFAAARRLFRVFFHQADTGEAAVHQLVGFANKARRNGIVSLDQDLATVEDPFLKQAIMLAVDGTESHELRRIMELKIENGNEIEEKIPAVFESAGGFSPTIGIIGAVLGLIQVMQHLDKIDEVGRGIAVAFVATIYGVAAANLFFLPAAGKLRIRAQQENTLKEMMLEGVISILEGMNPRILEIKLNSFLATPRVESEGPVGGKEGRGGMRRRRRSKSHISHERWLVSYADFITLMFAFFVVLFATSQADKKKQAVVAQAINQAFQSMGLFEPAKIDSHAKAMAESDDDAAAPVNIVLGEELGGSAAAKVNLAHIARELQGKLSNQIAQHVVALHIGRDGLVISLREAGFYDSGSATPHAASMKSLDEIAETLKASPYDIRIEGHTDNIPIHTSQFDSNWELSTARATRLARLFIERHGIQPSRLSASGYAEFHPVASNDTAEGRSENRRVDIIVLPRVTQSPETDVAAAPPQNMMRKDVSVLNASLAAARR